MSEERKQGLDIAVAVERTDWTRYAGPASYVKRRGERRRRRLQAGTALGTALAVVGVAAAANGLARGPVAQPEAVPASAVSDYPTFPAKLPTKPLLFSNRNVLRSGVIGAGAVSGHQWQISYRVIPSGSAANSQPEVSQVDVSLDGKVVTTGGGEGAFLGGHGYEALNQYFENTATPNPMVVALGSPSPEVTSVDLRWTNGTVVQVPIQTATGTRFASFAWNPANPPEAVEQVSAAGVQKIAITHDGDEAWYPGQTRPGGKLPSPIPGTPPSVHTPAGTPNLSQTPQVKKISSGILGEGTVSGRRWQLAYEIIPSGSAANDSNEVFCTDRTVDATTAQDGCTSSKPFTSRLGFFYSVHMALPLVIGYGVGEPRTTSIGLEWSDGTKVVNAMQDVEGNPMAAVAFDPAKPPSYLLEFGSYGEYRIPLTSETHYTWTFNWPN